MTEPHISKNKFKFRPKKFLKDLQQKIYVSRSLYLIFCFLVPISIMYVGYLVKGVFPFLNGSPLVLDLNAQYVYFFEALRNFIYGEGSLLYSFARSLGGEFMGIYAYYLASPLTYIVALFPQDRIQEAVLFILLLKTGLSGLSFGFYLHKRSRRPNRLAILVFSTMYALSSYMVVHQSNTMWIDALIWLPIFTYALENLISRKKYKLYVISLSIILICNYYIGYMICIFAVLYFFYYYFSKSKNEINPRKEKLCFIRTGTRFAIFSLLSAAISAFMLIAAYYSLGFGKSDFSSPNWSLTANFDVLDFLTKFLPGAYDTVEPAGLPFVYCGLLTVIMLPIYFTAKKISTREKVASAALISVFLISFFLSPVDLIWHGFSTPNWLNARYSFIFCFFILVLAYKGFGNLKQTSEKFLLVIGALLVLFAAVAEKFEMKSFINSKESLDTFSCVWFAIFFAIAITVLLCLRLRTKNRATSKSVAAVLVAVIFLELACNTAVCFLMFHKDVVFTTYSSYNDHLAELRPVVDQLNEYDDGFYRAEKTKHRTKNDNMALGLKGLTNSTSTLNSDAIEFTNSLGYTGRAHLTMYRGGTPFSDSVLGIKYVIDSTGSTRYSKVYNKVSQIESEKYNVMQNPYALSLAYGVDKDITEFSSDSHNTFFKRYNAMAAAMLGDESKVEMFKPVYGLKVSESNNCDVTEMALKIKCVTSENLSGNVTFEYKVPYSGNYYFYSPASSPEELTVKVNQKSVGSYLGRDTNHILHLGYHEQFVEVDGEMVQNTIKVSFNIPKDTEVSFHSQYDFLWYLDSEVYEDTMTRLNSAPQFNISADSTDDHLTGNITTVNAEQMILTTIPYDEGWNVYVDGEQVEIYETLDALMAFDISESGEHTLEMKYMPSCYKQGLALSVLGILVFVLICVVDIILKRSLFKNSTPAITDEFWVLEDFDVEEKPFSVIDTPKEESSKEVENSMKINAESQKNEENTRDK